MAFDMSSPLSFDALSELPQPPQRDIQPYVGKDELLDVLCINCYEMIQIDRIEKHSLVWIQVSPAVMNIECSSEIQQSTFKIQKIERSLYLLNQEIELSVGDKHYIDILLGLIGKAQSIYQIDEKTFDTLRQCQQSLASLIVTFRGSSSIWIYAERVKALLNDLIRLGVSQNHVEALDQVEVMKRQIERERIKFEEIREASGLQEIKSDVSASSQASSISAYTDELSSIASNLEVFEIERPQDLEEEQESDIQKNFYATFLGIKMSLSSRDPAQYVTAKKLWEKIQQAEISQDQWLNQITMELERFRELYKNRNLPKPIKEKRKKPKNRKSKRKGNKTDRFSNMEPIPEEEIGQE